jgi:hypothetical protein
MFMKNLQPRMKRKCTYVYNVTTPLPLNQLYGFKNHPLHNFKVNFQPLSNYQNPFFPIQYITE